MNRAVFLDRDGTLNPDPGYISDPEDFELFPGVLESLQRLASSGFLLVLITNQSGIARGLISLDQLEAIHEKLKNLLSSGGVNLAGIYFCPHHPDFPSETGISACDCRKPSPGLIFKALKELDIDPEMSYMIGDKLSDIESGLNAGVSPIFIGKVCPENYRHVPAFSSLNEASDWILAAE